RVMKERARQGDALLQSSGELTDRGARPVAQTEKLQRGTDLLLQPRKGEQRAEKPQVLTHRQIAVEEGRVGHKSDCSLGRRVAVNVLAPEQHLALTRPGQCRQKAKQGGFAGAVRTVKQNCVSRLDP